MKFNIYYAVVNAELIDEKILTFVVFEDGLVFEFQGRYGSLKSVGDISLEYETYLSSSLAFQENKVLFYDIFTSYENSLLSKYCDSHYDIKHFGKELTDSFLKKMVVTKHDYCSECCREMFDMYKRWI